MLYFGRRRWKSHVVVVLVVVLFSCVLIWRKDALFGAQGHERRLLSDNRVSERRKRIEQMCSALPPQPHQANYLHSNQVVVSWTNGFLHCPVAKAASTFWNRFLQTLTLSGPMRSPFSAPIADPADTVTSALNSLRHVDDRAAFVTAAFRNIFVRNPYSRLFSAYVDKVFAPNPTFWRFWGQKAIQIFRPDADPKSLRCGHDVTFAEVLAYARKRLYKSDIHFQPVFQLCKPCGFHYHFVGKMETFSRDLVLLARTLNLSNISYLESPQFRSDNVRDAIEDSINSPFSWMREILPCMSKYETGRRIWRKLQIRGLVSRRIRFPFSEAVFEDVTAEEMIEAALEAHGNSLDKAELQYQKRTALMEAFRSVNRSVLLQWTRILQEDFAMFGYEPHPSEVFGDGEIVSTGAFDWEKDW